MPATPPPADPLLSGLDRHPTLAAPGISDDYDALAHLFLGDAPEPARPRTPTEHPRPQPHSGRRSIPGGAAPIEVLVQGHLPVRAAPWPAQYARARAEQAGRPVALLRLSGGRLSVDLIGAAAPRPDPVETDDPRRALARAAHEAGLIVILPDELALPALAADARVEAVTVLAGTNDAAVVAAYRTIKALAEGRVEPHDEDAPSFRIALVGGDREQAGAALEKITRASALFLERPVELAGIIERVAPTGGRTLFRGACEASPSAIIDELRSRPVAHAPTPTREPRTSPPDEADQRAGAVCAPPRETATQSLAVNLPGLSPLAARCPDDPDAELAVDRDGAIHVLRRHDGAGSFALLAGAAAWAEKHANLLALAPSPGAAVNPALPVVAHLFTDRPREVRHLLDARVRLHVLSPGAGPGAFCADLN